MVQFLVLADDSGLEIEALGGRPGIPPPPAMAGPGASDEGPCSQAVEGAGALRGQTGRAVRLFFGAGAERHAALESEGDAGNDCEGAAVDKRIRLRPGSFSFRRLPDIRGTKSGGEKPFTAIVRGRFASLLPQIRQSSIVNRSIVTSGSMRRIELQLSIFTGRGISAAW